jgi:hypothetical protein
VANSPWTACTANSIDSAKSADSASAALRALDAKAGAGAAIAIATGAAGIGGRGEISQRRGAGPVLAGTLADLRLALHLDHGGGRVQRGAVGRRPDRAGRLVLQTQLALARRPQPLEQAEHQFLRGVFGGQGGDAVLQRRDAPVQRAGGASGFLGTRAVRRGDRADADRRIPLDAQTFVDRDMVTTSHAPSHRQAQRLPV